MKAEPDKKDNRVRNSLVCGALCGSISKCIVAPLERVQIFLQVSDTKISYKFILEKFANIFTNEGIISFWRGINVVVYRTAIYCAIQFFTFEFLKKKLSYNDEETSKLKFSTTSKLLSGSCAGMAAIFVTYPLDLIHSRIVITTKQKHGGMITSTKSLYLTKGFRGFYKGIHAGLLGIVPFTGVTFFTNETCKEIYYKYNPSAVDIPPKYNLIFGAISGFSGTLSSYPFDLSRKRMQCGTINPETDTIGIISTVTKLYKSEGIKGVYKGLSFNCIKNPIAIGCAFYIYEYLQKILSNI